MQKYYAVYIEKDIRLVIPWSKPEPPVLLEIAQTLSYVWGIVGTDFSFGPPIKIEEVDVYENEKPERDQPERPYFGDIEV